MVPCFRPLALISATLCLMGTATANPHPADPSTLFTKAYRAYKAGQNSEIQNPSVALDHYRQAETSLLEILKNSPTWQPVIVKYRLTRTQEAISRLNPQNPAKNSSDKNSPPPSTTSTALDLEGPLPSADPADLIPDDDPALTSIAPQTPAPNLLPTLSLSSQNFSAQRHSVQSISPLQPQTQFYLQDLSQLRNQLAASLAENNRLSRQLIETQNQLRLTISELDKTKVTTIELRSRLSDESQAAAQRLTLAEENFQKSLNQKTSQLLEQIQRANQEAETLRAENLQLQTKLKESAQNSADTSALLTERDNLRAERDALLTELATTKQLVASLQLERNTLLEERDAANQNAFRIQSELTATSQQLAEKDSQILQLTNSYRLLAQQAEEAANNASGDLKKSLEELQEQLKSVNSQLADASSSLAAREADLANLKAELATAESELQSLKNTPRSDPELLKENQLLRNILIREIRLQTARDEARKALETELASLLAESQPLRELLATLSRPALELSPQESELLSEAPSLLPIQDESNRIELQLSVRKPSTNPEDNSSFPSTPNTPSQTTHPQTDPPTSEALKSAQFHFNKKDYATALEIYQQLANTHPDDPFILANLGALQIETGQLEAASNNLKQALHLDPDLAFAQTKLGIICFRQSRFDDAILHLTKALELDPSDAIAHNFLALCLSEKGNRSASENHLKKAIAINPNYANAHFNLAVLYSTADPPSTELAKQHYQIATQLGASPDLTTENIMQ